jgi:regulator of replication initiation timing
MANTLTDAMAQLEKNIQQLESDTKWACAEIERQRAEIARLMALNNELSLKNENLLYWIRSNIQAVVN